MNTTPKKTTHYPDEVRDAARGMYLKKYSIAEIGEALGVPGRTLYSWADRGQWDKLLAHETKEEALTRRLVILSGKDKKDEQDIKELEKLVGWLERLQNMRLREEKQRMISLGCEAGAYNENGEKLSIPGPKRKSRYKNDVSHLTANDFEKLHKDHYTYQRELAVAQTWRNRMILKSRQIGATWYFAQEAFENAVLTGDNQLFLSATKNQSQVFKNYIVQIAAQKFNLELKGNPLILHTAHGPAELHFLSTSAQSAQSYHGHLYMDEFFWIRSFEEFFKVASGMASHKKWRRTLFSTPSAITHGAYPLWSGEKYLSRFKKHVEWPNNKAFRAGLECPDTWWRKIITLNDAIKGGCDLFDLEQLKLEYSVEEFKQLYGCEFIDDSESVFSLKLLETCLEDPATWKEFKKTFRPVGSTPVWAGYDPSRTGDDASFSILLPPQAPGDKFKEIDNYTWRNKTYLWQAAEIKKLSERYNFQHIGIDTTGPGIGVFEMVSKFSPFAVGFHYSPAIKAKLVLKALGTMEQGRLAWDAGQSEVAYSFLTIKRESTSNGQITYTANRTKKTGHADRAWAIMHALGKEELADKTEENFSMVSF